MHKTKTTECGLKVTHYWGKLSKKECIALLEQTDARRDWRTRRYLEERLAELHVQPYVRRVWMRRRGLI